MPKAVGRQEPKTVLGYFLEARRMRRERLAIDAIMSGGDRDLQDILRMAVQIEMRPPGMTSQELIRQLERTLRGVLLPPDNVKLGKSRRKMLAKAGYEVVSCAEEEPNIATVGVTVNGSTIFAPQPKRM